MEEGRVGEWHSGEKEQPCQNMTADPMPVLYYS